MNLDLKHFNSFTNDIIVVDGFWGGGKSVVTSLIGSMTGVEKKKVEHVYEYVCIAHSAGKMNGDAAMAFLKIYADLSQYNNLIGREVNLRWSDDSGLRNNPGSLTYLKRLFHPGGDNVAEKISKENLALLIASHELIAVSDLLYESFGSRLKLIEVVRHPVHLFNNVRDYTATFERAREFTLSFEVNGVKVPWFAAKWADEFVTSSVTDRALLSIARMQSEMINAIDSINAAQKPLLVLSFENTVLQPQDSINRLEKFLDRQSTRRTKRVLKQQNLPRQQISAGKATSSYSFTSSGSSSENEIYKKILSEIQASGSASAITEFRSAISTYNSRWPSQLSELEKLWAE
jgi:hypothetical protein